VTVLTAPFYFFPEKVSKLAWRLNCCFLWVPILFIFGDFLFYQYSGIHLSKEHWTYIDPKSIYFIRKSITDQFLNPNSFILAVPLIGTLAQRYFFLAASSPNNKRDSSIFLINILIIFGISLFSNHFANSHQAGLIMHKSGLGRNPIIYNLGLAFENTKNDNIAPDSESIHQFQQEHNLGRKWEPLTPHFPWIRKLMKSDHCTPRKKNLIFVFLESFSASSTAPLSPYFHNTTPEFEKLSREGSLFTKAFMSGIPTAPALASSLCSMHDTQSVVRNHADLNLMCGAEILRNHGYRTALIANQDMDFDNMKNFFGQNGFEDLIGDQQFKIPAKNDSLPGQFGKHNDAELFEEAMGWMDQHSSSQAPFFLSLVTTSNHDPFPQYGEQFRSQEGTGKLQRAHGTMKYVDHALGEWIKAMKTRPYYKNTIIFIFADHPSWFSEIASSHPAPNNVIINSWIPLLILNPEGLTPGKSYDVITSQVDLMPTALDMLGICDTQSGFAGHSLIDPSIADEKRFALVLAGHFERSVWIEKHYALSYHERSQTAEFFNLAQFPRKISKIDPLVTFAGFHPKNMLESLTNTLHINRWAIETNHIWDPSQNAKN